MWVLWAAGRLRAAGCRVHARERRAKGLCRAGAEAAPAAKGPVELGLAGASAEDRGRPVAAKARRAAADRCSGYDSFEFSLLLILHG